MLSEAIDNGLGGTVCDNSILSELLTVECLAHNATFGITEVDSFPVEPSQPILRHWRKRLLLLLFLLPLVCAAVELAKLPRGMGLRKVSDNGEYVLTGSNLTRAETAKCRVLSLATGRQPRFSHRQSTL